MNQISAIWQKVLMRFQTRRGSSTVRYMFPMLLVFLAFLGANAITSVNESYIKLVPNRSTLQAGETFFIDIYAYAHVPVNALDVTISFDPKVIDVTAVDQGQSVITIWTTEPTIENGTITLGGGTYRRGFIGEHLIATIKARALTQGKTQFFLQEGNMLAGDGAGTPVKLTADSIGTEETFVIYSQGTDPSVISADISATVSADIDGDGQVTLRDVSAFMAAWYEGQKNYDFNADGRMNFIDFSIILARSFFRSSQ